MNNLIEFAKAFSDLGASIQDQLIALTEGDTSDINPNAIKAARKALGRFDDELAEIMDDFLEQEQ